MNPALLSFYPQFLLDEKTGNNKTPKVQVFDETPYVDNGIALANVAGVILLAKRENVEFYANADYANPDVTLSPVLNEKIDAPVDSTDNILYGEYDLTYKVQVINEILGINADTTAPGSATFDSLNYEGATIADFVAKVNQLVAYQGTSFKIEFLNASNVVLGSSIVTGAELVGSDLVVSFDSITLVSYAAITTFRFKTYYSATVSVSYCSQTWPTAKLIAVGDCIKAQISVQDQTSYSASDTIDRNIYFNYPVLADGTVVHAQETTTLASMLVGPSVWTGNYTIALVSEITRTQTDTLVLVKTLTAYNYFNLQCDAGLCCMRDCIDSIFTAYKKAVNEGSAQLATLTANMIVINTLVMQYKNAIDCGETEIACNYLDALKSYMESIGCSCGCTDCGTDTEPVEVFPLFSDPYPTYVPLSYLEEDNITVNSNLRVPTNKAVINYLGSVLANYYTETEIINIINNLLTGYYTIPEVQANFMPIQPFDSSNISSGAETETLTGKSGIYNYSPGSPIPAGDIATLTLDNADISISNMVVISLEDVAGGVTDVSLVSVTPFDNGVIIKIKNTSAGQWDDVLPIRFIVF